jgi:RNA polymerase sigma-70 factor (ECF subfamily)
MTSSLHDRRADTIAATPVPVPDAAFDDLFRRQWSSVVNYLRFRVGPQGAQDVAADVFARAWERRHGFDGARGDLSTWLWAIARNTATSRLRLHTPLTLPLEAADGSQDLAHELADHQDEMDRVVAAMHCLSALDHEIIALRFGAGLSHRGVGEALGISEDNAAVRLHRAIRRLRLEVEGEVAK